MDATQHIDRIDGPSVTEQARERLDRLSPKQRTMLQEKLQRRQGDIDLRRITPLPADVTPPIAPAQANLWLHDQIMSGVPLYNTCHHVRLTGRLNIPALERSLQTIVQRHAALRANFSLVNGEPALSIKPTLSLTLPLIDLSREPAETRRAHAEAYIREDALRPFDLAHDPLLRTTLVRLADEEHLLLMTVHHIVFDGWSAMCFYQELTACYTAYAQGASCTLPLLPIQYTDIAAWQQQCLHDGLYEKQAAYWQQQLHDAAELILPNDFLEPATRIYRATYQSCTLPPDIVDGIHALCRLQNCTPFMVIAAAFAGVLHRYSGQDDLVFGVPAAGRMSKEMEPLIGFLVNNLVLRFNYAGDPTAREMLARTRAVTQEAFSHQDIPFYHVLEALRSSTGKVPFNVRAAINYRHFPQPTISLPGLTLEHRLQDKATTLVDMMLDITVLGDAYTVVLCGDSELFSDDTIARVLGHLQEMLAGMTTDPDCPLSRLPLLTAQERQQILVEWNATEKPYPSDTCIHALFAAQAERTPNATAVIFRNTQMTYGELNARANQLAHHLRALGVGPEKCVGLCVERTPDILVGVLGILKAGGAFVPLDPEYPRERLAFMLEDVQVQVLLTHASLCERLRVPAHTPVLCLDKDWPVIAAAPVTNPPVNTRPDNLAYIIYTSGSTGRPKGAMLTHRGVCNLAPALIEAFAITARSRVALFASISFDVAVGEIFSTFFCGASLYLYERTTLHRTDLLHELAANEVTVVCLGPSLLGLLSDPGESSLATLVVWGEDCPAELARRWQARRRFINGYGPTETTVISTYYRAEEGRTGHPPIGRPLANTRVYVLDPAGQPVPVGVAGELFIAGVGLARGYFGREELTTERFPPDPFAAAPDTRMYRTGDLVRWLPDGNLEFLTRMDDQVKIRGLRIEPQEIATTAMTHPAVRDAVALGMPDAHGETSIVLYFVPQPGQTPTRRELLLHLSTTLPTFMLPTAIICLEQFPRTPSGKVDRRALPAPELASQIAQVSVSPRNILELQLVQIWEHVLEVAPVGVTDDFFALGGHSLLALRMLAQIEQELGHTLLPSTLLQAPTIAQLAELLCREGWTPKPSALFPFNADGTQPPLIFVTPPSGTALMCRELAHGLGPDQPLLVLQSPEDQYTTVPRMAAEKIRDLQVKGIKGPYLLCGYSFSGLVAYDMAQQLTAAGEQVSLLVLLDTRNPMLKTGLARIRRWVINVFTRGLHEGFSYFQQSIHAHLSRRTPQKTHAEQPAIAEKPPITMELVRRAIAVAKQYHPTAYPGRLTLFRTRESTDTVSILTDDLGWKRVMRERLDIRFIEGTHATLIKAQHSASLACELLTCLQQVNERHDG